MKTLLLTLFLAVAATACTTTELKPVIMDDGKVIYIERPTYVRAGDTVILEHKSDISQSRPQHRSKVYGLYRGVLPEASTRTVGTINYSFSYSRGVFLSPS